MIEYVTIKVRKETHKRLKQWALDESLTVSKLLEKILSGRKNEN